MLLKSLSLRKIGEKIKRKYWIILEMCIPKGALPLWTPKFRRIGHLSLTSPWDAYLYLNFRHESCGLTSGHILRNESDPVCPLARRKDTETSNLKNKLKTNGLPAGICRLRLGSNLPVFFIKKREKHATLHNLNISKDLSLRPTNNSITTFQFFHFERRELSLWRVSQTPWADRNYLLSACFPAETKSLNQTLSTSGESQHRNYMWWKSCSQYARVIKTLGFIPLSCDVSSQYITLNSMKTFNPHKFNVNSYLKIIT